MIKQLRSQHGDNFSYVIYDEEGGRAALVDPVARDTVEQFLRSRSLEPGWLINTHGHGDHTGANSEFQLQRNVEVLAHSRARSRIGKLDRELEDGEVLDLPGEKIKILHSPGHTDGGLCLVGDEHLISGDTLFLAGCGNPKFGGDTRDLFRSIKNKLRPLPDHLKLFPGHDYARKNLEFAVECNPKNEAAREKLDYVKGVSLEGRQPESTLGEEKKYNPFFNFDDPQWRDELTRLSASPTDWKVFKRLRELRNNW